MVVCSREGKKISAVTEVEPAFQGKKAWEDMGGFTVPVFGQSNSALGNMSGNLREREAKVKKGTLVGGVKLQRLEGGKGYTHHKQP